MGCNITPHIIFNKGGINVSKLVNIDALEAASERAQSAISEVAELALEAASAEYYSATIPTSAWVDNTDTAIANEGYDKMANVAITGITANDGSNTDIAIVSRSIAVACGMAHISQTISGYVRFYAKSVPTDSISVQIQVSRVTASS